MGKWRLRVSSLWPSLGRKAPPRRAERHVPKLPSDPPDRPVLNGQSFLALFVGAGHWATYVGTVIDERLLLEIIDRPLESHGAHHDHHEHHIYIDQQFAVAEDEPLFATVYESFAGHPGLHGLLRNIEKQGARVVGYHYRQKRFYTGGNPKLGPRQWGQQSHYTLIAVLPHGASWERHDPTR